MKPTSPKQLALFLEGQGDVDAVPTLVNAILAEQMNQDCLYLGNPFKVGDLMDLLLGKQPRLHNFLSAALKRSNLGAVLLLLDGDTRLPPNIAFCPGRLAQDLAQAAQKAGAGATFSFAAVFAMREYESWLLATVESLAGQPLPPTNLPGIRANAVSPTGDLEQHPRDAKRAIGDLMINKSYKPTKHQAPLTRLLVKGLSVLRQKNLRSFRRLETSLQVLAEAMRTGKHISIPSP